jgi:hypothetical protein
MRNLRNLKFAGLFKIANNRHTQGRPFNRQVVVAFLMIFCRDRTRPPCGSYLHPTRKGESDRGHSWHANANIALELVARAVGGCAISVSHTHTHTHTHTPTHTHVYTHTHTHTRTHARTHTHTRARAHTHAHCRRLQLSLAYSHAAGLRAPDLCPHAWVPTEGVHKGHSLKI